MKNIVIIPNMKKNNSSEVTTLLVSKLSKMGFSLYVSKDYYDVNFVNVSYYDEFPKSIDLIIVVGGDGSVLDASVYAISENVPLIGVNLGKVGYLSEVEPDNLDVFHRLSEGKYAIEEKMLLGLKIKEAENTISSSRLAVNDVVISHDNFLGISDFKIENSKGDGIKYRADSIIFSTPCGSTAYSLSAGGPVVSHDVDTILVTPVCPHSFFNRSILFNSSDKITITNMGNSAMNVSIDGRTFTKLSPLSECTVEVSNKKLKMLTFTENDMFSTLFKKMRIMEDVK